MMEQLTDKPEINANDFVMAKNMADLLNRQYPNHLWAVTCQGDQGIATVRNLRLSGHLGYIIKLADLYQDPSMKAVLRAGGEILERYRLSRGKFNEDQYTNLPMTRSGLFIAEK